MNEIFDTSVWPYATPDLFWALSDTVHDAFVVQDMTSDTIEYDLPLHDLNRGAKGLQSFTAVRNIRLDLSEWPLFLSKKIRSATLCWGSKALQTIDHDPEDPDEVLRFDIFQGRHILPIFVADEGLGLSIETEPLDDDSEKIHVPAACARLDGLVATVRQTNVPFLVAATNECILTWDGVQSRLLHKASSSDSSVSLRASLSGQLASDRELAQDLVVHDKSSTIEDLWNSLR